MKRIPAIKSVMTAFPYWINMTEDLDAAERMMDEHNISHLPVKEEGKLTGVISRHDIERQRLTLGDSKDGPRVKDVCILNLYTVDLDEPLDNVVNHMANNHIGSALIMKNDRLAGVFTMNDACRCFVEYMRYQFRTNSGDDRA